jgi:hypothetical protein
MEFRSVLFTVISAILVISIYSSSPMFPSVEGVIDGDISCSPQGNGKTYCCADILDKNGYTSTTYCTMCDDTKPPSNCSKRERPLTVQEPGKYLSNILEGGVLKNPRGELPELQQSNTTFSDKVAPKSGRVFELPEEGKTFNEENNTSKD